MVRVGERVRVSSAGMALLPGSTLAIETKYMVHSRHASVRLVLGLGLVLVSGLGLGRHLFGIVISVVLSHTSYRDRVGGGRSCQIEES